MKNHKNKLDFLSIPTTNDFIILESFIWVNNCWQIFVFLGHFRNLLNEYCAVSMMAVSDVYGTGLAWRYSDSPSDVFGTGVGW